MSRENRKLEHLECALKFAELPINNGFSDIYLVNDALPELDFDQIDTFLDFLDKKLSAPLLINAMTGGHPDVKQINTSLAKVAAMTGIALAVGSQTAGLENPEVRHTYRVARDENPDGVLLANLSALASLDMAKEAIDMIAADGIQLHLNAAQELSMGEGDRKFGGTLANIEKIVKESPVPVIIKEVGYGLSRETVQRLYDAGVRYIDIGGKGGTDFVKIENMRSNRDADGTFQNIGILTAPSLIETLSLNLPVTIIGSGGFTGGTDTVSALVLGAKLVGIAGHFLQVYAMNSEEGLYQRIQNIIDNLRRTMLMIGAANLVELAGKPAVITGFTAEWLLRRGVDISKYGQRKGLGAHYD